MFLNAHDNIKGDMFYLSRLFTGHPYMAEAAREERAHGGSDLLQQNLDALQKRFGATVAKGCGNCSAPTPPAASDPKELSASDKLKEHIKQLEKARLEQNVSEQLELAVAAEENIDRLRAQIETNDEETAVLNRELVSTLPLAPAVSLDVDPNDLDRHPQKESLKAFMESDVSKVFAEVCGESIRVKEAPKPAASSLAPGSASGAPPGPGDGSGGHGSDERFSGESISAPDDQEIDTTVDSTIAAVKEDAPFCGASSSEDWAAPRAVAKAAAEAAPSAPVARPREPPTAAWRYSANDFELELKLHWRGGALQKLSQSVHALIGGWALREIRSVRRFAWGSGVAGLGKADILGKFEQKQAADRREERASAYLESRGTAGGDRSLEGRGAPLAERDEDRQMFTSDAGERALTRALKDAGIRPASIEAAEELRRAEERVVAGLRYALRKDRGASTLDLEDAVRMAREHCAQLVKQYNSALLLDKETFGGSWPLQQRKQRSIEAGILRRDSCRSALGERLAKLGKKCEPFAEPHKSSSTPPARETRSPSPFQFTPPARATAQLTPRRAAAEEAAWPRGRLHLSRHFEGQQPREVPRAGEGGGPGEAWRPRARLRAAGAPPGAAGAAGQQVGRGQPGAQGRLAGDDDVDAGPRAAAETRGRGLEITRMQVLRLVGRPGAGPVGRSPDGAEDVRGGDAARPQHEERRGQARPQQPAGAEAGLARGQGQHPEDVGRHLQARDGRAPRPGMADGNAIADLLAWLATDLTSSAQLPGMWKLHKPLAGHARQGHASHQTLELALDGTVVLREVADPSAEGVAGGTSAPPLELRRGKLRPARGACGACPGGELPEEDGFVQEIHWQQADCAPLLVKLHTPAGAPGAAHPELLLRPRGPAGSADAARAERTEQAPSSAWQGLPMGRVHDAREPLPGQPQNPSCSNPLYPRFVLLAQYLVQLGLVYAPLEEIYGEEVPPAALPLAALRLALGAFGAPPPEPCATRLEELLGRLLRPAEALRLPRLEACLHRLWSEPGGGAVARLWRRRAGCTGLDVGHGPKPGPLPWRRPQGACLRCAALTPETPRSKGTDAQMATPAKGAALQEAVEAS
ncbi:unnamed protein product, partial [Prorocentrum cordatum]